jgi:hypothetical protein
MEQSVSPKPATLPETRRVDPDTQSGEVHPRIDGGLWGCIVVRLQMHDIGPYARPMDIGTQRENPRDALVARWRAP